MSKTTLALAALILTLNLGSRIAAAQTNANGNILNNPTSNGGANLGLALNSNFKDANTLSQMAGEAAISGLRQKVTQLTQSFQMRGQKNQIFFVTTEALGCSQLNANTEETVASLKYSVSTKKNADDFRTEKISYYGCNGTLLFSEVLQVKNLKGLPTSQALTAQEILGVIRRFYTDETEERRLYRIVANDDQTVLATFDAYRSNQGWIRTNISVAGNILLELRSWTDPTTKIQRTEMHKPAYTYKLQINNSTTEVDSSSDISYKMILTDTGLRYLQNGDLIPQSAFDLAINEILLRIGNTRVAFVLQASMTGFPQSQSAPKLNRLIEQLTEAKILLESNQNKDRVLELVNDILAGANKGQINDGR